MPTKNFINHILSKYLDKNDYSLIDQTTGVYVFFVQCKHYDKKAKKGGKLFFSGPVIYSPM